MANDRAKIIEKYKTILGRNKYSQARRSYVFTKYKDGKYYSDCSSSIAATYKACGHPITYGGSSLPNTVGMYHSKDLVDVSVTIKNGIIQNSDVLQVGDMLLFAGTDKSRSGSGYVGHVEMVAEISGGKVTIFGHGSGTPRKTEMNAYCKSRFSSKTSTAKGNKGLIKVRRHKDFMALDVTADPVTGPCVKIVNCQQCNVRCGPDKKKFKSVGLAKPGDVFSAMGNPDEWVPIIWNGEVRWISKKYAEEVK